MTHLRPVTVAPAFDSTTTRLSRWLRSARRPAPKTTYGPPFGPLPRDIAIGDVGLLQGDRLRVDGRRWNHKHVHRVYCAPCGSIFRGVRPHECRNGVPAAHRADGVKSHAGAR
jgi:hypothetical protein